jgi:hypothetical protein
MGQQNQKQQKPMQEKNNGNHSIVKKFTTVFKGQQKKAYRRLPLEMECEIFKCLKFEIRRKFISGMGRGIYGMFRHKLLIKVW